MSETAKKIMEAVYTDIINKKTDTLRECLKKATGLELENGVDKITRVTFDGKPDYEEYFYNHGKPGEVFLMSFNLVYPNIWEERPFIPRMIFTVHGCN